MTEVRGDEGRAADPGRDGVPATLLAPGAGLFWILVALTGAGAGLGGALLTLLLKFVQDLSWGIPAGSPPGTTLLDAAALDGPLRHVALLVGAGLVTGLGQVVLKRLSSGNGIDLMAAIWFRAGRLPAVRTLGGAVLSIVVVGMGTSLGREGAPKQAGAVVGDLLAGRARLGDERRRLLVACGAGAGMAAAYGVPLGGALFAIEVLRGALSLRLVLPALLCSTVASAVSWTLLPDAPTYRVPSYAAGPAAFAFAFAAGPVLGVAAVGFVRAVATADRNRPTGWRRIVAPVLGLGIVGAISVPLPQVLGNGKDVAELAMTGALALPLLLALVLAKPLSVLLCYGSGAPGGLFTPTLATGALLGGVLGHLWALAGGLAGNLAGAPAWPGVGAGPSAGLCALLGAGAMLAATTQGPVSSVVLLMELTGRDRSFVAPLLVAVVAATAVARTIDPRSIYEARLGDDEVRRRLRDRDPHPGAAP